MNLHEFIPIVSGLFIGLLLYFAPRHRKVGGLLLIPSFGFLAAFSSGELQTSWLFLLIDIPMVAGSAAVSFLAVHFFRLFLKKSV